INEGIYSPSNYTFILYNVTALDDSWYQIKKNKQDFQDNISMVYDTVSRTWVSQGDYIGPGDYTVRFYIQHTNGNVSVIERVFYVEGTAVVKWPWIFVGVGGGVGIGVVGTLTAYAARAGKLSFLKNLGKGGGAS
ncbi:MAG: hypothetical protein ACTSPI_04795, partial [Candidatus Heimdallarchaeaceae archaeon]